jgi:predicted TIM-barrel fold metal-dependent hydrolase
MTPWIDTHTHVSRSSPDGSARPHLLDDLLAVLDGDAADLRLVISPDSADLARIIAEPDGQVHAARFIHDLVRRAPGRLYGACCVNPHHLDFALQVMDLCLGEFGFPLFGEMLQYMMHFRMDTPAVETLVRRAVEFNVPVQVHISTSNSAQGHFTSGNEELADLCDLYDKVPEARYILAHFVGTDKLPPVVDGYLDDLDRRYGCFPDNMWAEIRDFSSPGVKSALERIPHDRLIAGTDWVTRVGPPFPPYGVLFPATSADENPYPPSVAAMTDLLRQAGASEDSIRMIAWDNAARLLRLAV